MAAQPEAGRWPRKLESMERRVTAEAIEVFKRALYEDEKRTSTIGKYMRDLGKFLEFLGGREVSKERLVQYKEYLQNSGEYKVSSINSFLAVVNHFCEVMGWTELRVKTLKVQEGAFSPEHRELTQEEYGRLVEAAAKRGDERLALIIQTLASTGIRISELQFVTVESLEVGMADIYNKGKMRRILYPSDLQEVLAQYARGNQLEGGPVFCTRNGKAVDRSNVWKAMKKLSVEAGVDAGKVFPHSLRHLFAKCFYEIKKDLAKLADVLGHSSIETTRIYIRSTGREHKKQLDMMKMAVITSLRGGQGGKNHGGKDLGDAEDKRDAGNT